MKKIVIISSTPRKNGNSELLAESFAKGAKDAGHEVTVIKLRELNYSFCKGCELCQKTKKCTIKDDVTATLPAVAEADVIVFATPVYYYAMSGQLKTYIDRMNPLYSVGENKVRDIYLLATAFDTSEFAVQAIKKEIKAWCACFNNSKLKKTLFIGGVAKPNDIKSVADALDKAFALGQKC